MKEKVNTKAQGTENTAQKQVTGTDNCANMVTMLEVISGFKTDLTTLTPQQTAFVNQQSEEVRPIAEKLCINGNRREYSEVDFMFSIYCYHVARYNNNNCSVQSTLKTLPDCFGIDGSETDTENIRKSFKAFDKYFTSPENVELFRKFGVTKLRILSMVHDSNVDKVIAAIANGTLRPDITVSNLREKVKEFNGTKNRINLDFTEKKSAKKSETEKTSGSEAEKTSGSETEKTSGSETEKPTAKTAEKPVEKVSNVCDDSDKYNEALEIAVKYIRYMTDYTSLANIFDDIRNKLS